MIPENQWPSAHSQAKERRKTARDLHFEGFITDEELAAAEAGAAFILSRPDELEPPF